MNLVVKQLSSFIISLLVGVLLEKHVTQLYFVGFILIFIVIFGRNQQQLNQRQQTKESSLPISVWMLGVAGYILAGIIGMLI